MPDTAATPDPFDYAEGVPKWERQKGETGPAYDGFFVYARLPYSHPAPDGRDGARSIAKAAEVCGKNKSLLERWSRRWRWVERAREFDIDRRREERDALRKAEADQAATLARRRMAFRDKAWNVFERTVTRVDDLLSIPVHENEKEVVVEKYEDGRAKTVHITRTPSDNWTPANGATLLRAGLLAGQLGSDDGSGVLDALVAGLDYDNLPDDLLDVLETGDAYQFFEALIATRTYDGASQSGESEAQEARD